MVMKPKACREESSKQSLFTRHGEISTVVGMAFWDVRPAFICRTDSGNPTGNLGRALHHELQALALEIEKWAAAELAAAGAVPRVSLARRRRSEAKAREGDVSTREGKRRLS